MVTLRTALGDYAVFEALRNGSVAIDGVTFDFPEFPAIIPEFRKMCRTLDYDVCEMSLGCYFAARDHGRPFTAIPAIALQQPQHRNVVYNSKSGIQRARDLEGTRVGLRGYTVTSGIWGRGILAMDYGLDHTKVNWVPSDDEHVSESNALLPANVTPRLELTSGRCSRMGIWPPDSGHRARATTSSR
jgi:4,5-dihydroxyphthalate decarboxylase